MCEAEDKLRKVYLWLRETHFEVYQELDKLEAKEAFG